MANCCEYKVIVKGKKNACYAFFGSMSCMDYKDIVDEEGTDDEFVLSFEGNCKWSVDSYCTPWEGEFPVKLPDDYEDAYSEGEEKYWYNTVQERSMMFEVEVLCNSADVEDYNPAEGPFQIYKHYINGVDIGGICPDELCIKGWYEDDEDDEDEDDDYDYDEDVVDESCECVECNEQAEKTTNDKPKKESWIKRLFKCRKS